MSKLVVRVTIICVACYLIGCYLSAAIFGLDIWCQWYYLLFELCVCLCISKQGVYHCKYIKWTAYAILLDETLAYVDALTNYLSNDAAVIIHTTLLTMGVAITTILAVKHYIRVRKIKKIWR